MAVSTLHVLHGITLPSGLFVSQLTDAGPQAGIEALVAHAAGHPQPLFAATRMVKPDVPFTSTQLKGLLDLLQVFGASTAAGNTDLYLKKVTDLGVREAAASTVHLRLRAAQGYLYWTGIEASDGQDATIACRFVPTFDGTNAPVVAAGSLALSGTPAVDQLFTLGPVKLNGSFVPGVKRWSLELGCTVFEETADGDTYSTFFAVKEIAPVLTLSLLESTVWTTFGAGGAALTGLIAYLRRKSPDGPNYADGSAQHISLTATAGMIHPQRAQGGGNEGVTNELRCVLRAPDAAGNVLALNTATTIT